MLEDQKRYQADIQQKPERQSPELSLAQAKKNFRLACATYEPLGVVRRHPFAAPFCALAAGFIFVRMLKPVAGIAVLPMALQAAQIAAKFILGLRKQ